jgi:hypothetical protein
MAKAEQVPTDLTLDISDDLAPEEFVAAVRNFFGYVKEITEAQAGDGAKINWTVRVKEGSSLIGLEPAPSAPASRLAMVYRKIEFGVEAMARGDLEAAGLTDKALGHLKGLSELVAKSEAKRPLKLWVQRRSNVIGAGIANTIRESLETDYYDLGTLEGRLEAIQDASGSLKIRIQDYLYPRPINCVVPERMIDLVFASFRRRVEVGGRIHYRRDGTPISIEADAIDLLPEDDDLPTAASVRGILASA